MTTPSILQDIGCTYNPPGTILAVIEVGSTLHGTGGDEGSDDLDLHVVVAEKPSCVTGLSTWDSHVWRTAADGQQSFAGDVDVTFYGLRKFIGLACQGNPSILAPLFAPGDKEHYYIPEWEWIVESVEDIVSIQALPRFRGYMRSQCLRLTGEKGMGRGARTGARPELVAKYGYDTKFAMHMVRLGLQGLELARTGRLTLPLDEPDGGTCRAIRRGEWTAEDAIEFAVLLDSELAKYLKSNETRVVRKSVLKDAPAYDAVNRLLHDVYVSVWTQEEGVGNEL